MNDKYESRIENAHAVVIIPSGPAAGEYRLYMPEADTDGNIMLGVIEINGRRGNVKIKASEHQGMLAAYSAHMRGREAAHAENEAARPRTLDEQMRASGFEEAGVTARIANQLFPVKGASF